MVHVHYVFNAYSILSMITDDHLQHGGLEQGATHIFGIVRAQTKNSWIIQPVAYHLITINNHGDNRFTTWLQQ